MGFTMPPNLKSNPFGGNQPSNPSPQPTPVSQSGNPQSNNMPSAGWGGWRNQGRGDWKGHQGEGGGGYTQPSAPTPQNGGPQPSQFPSGNMSINDPRVMQMLRGGMGMAQMFSNGNPFPQGGGQPQPNQMMASLLQQRGGAFQ
jgi:hypothetical protein